LKFLRVLIIELCTGPNGADRRTDKPTDSTNYYYYYYYVKVTFIHCFSKNIHEHASDSNMLQSSLFSWRQNDTAESLSLRSAWYWWAPSMGQYIFFRISVLGCHGQVGVQDFRSAWLELINIGMRRT